MAVEPVQEEIPVIMRAEWRIITALLSLYIAQVTNSVASINSSIEYKSQLAVVIAGFKNSASLYFWVGNH